MTSHHLHQQDGFTLIEVIVMIAMAALLGVLLIQFSGSSLINSAKSVSAVQDSFSVDDVMEQITRDYQIWLTTGDNNLANFLSLVQTNYGASIVAGETGMVTPQPGQDVANTILQVTVVDGDYRLTTLFTR